MFARSLSLGIVVLAVTFCPLEGAYPPLEDGFDVVPFIDGNDTFTRSVWDDGGGLPGFSKAKAGYSIRTVAVDVPAIVYEWAIPGHHLSGSLTPGTTLFFTYGQESEVQWTTETCNLAPKTKSAEAKFWYINNMGFPKDQGPGRYYEPQAGGTICQPNVDDRRESLKTGMHILNDDDEVAVTLVEFESTVELTDDGQYDYIYTVTNNTQDALAFDWSDVQLTGLLDPLGVTSLSLRSPLPPIEVLIHASAAFEPIVTVTAAFDPIPAPTTGGIAMAGPSMVFAPVPEPAAIILLATSAAWLPRRRR